MDEPPELLRHMNHYSRALLGALLVQPSRAAGPDVSKLTDADCPSELLARVLTLARWNPAAEPSQVVQACVRGSGSFREAADAIGYGWPWYADWYAFQLRRLSRSRRRFWDHMKAAQLEYFEMQAESRAPQIERRLALADTQVTQDSDQPQRLDEF